MTSLVNLTSKSDIIGAAASTLCFVHCLATPLLFAAHAGLMTEETAHPWWWGMLDMVFLGISFFAVYWSVKNTTKTWIRYAFWALWLVLAFIIINEKFEITHLAEETIYLPTLALISLHFYNRRYCKCGNDVCCVEQ